MGSVKPEGSIWSDNQWKAITHSGDHILVAAAAGSGKTAVLVERIIRKIMNEEDGFSVDRLLVATFTKAAASEMRQRIREALDKELEKEPDNAHLRRQLALLGKASITTLHSFCMEVIRRYYQWIPLDPGFRILNQNEAELLRQEILEQLFEEKYGQAGDEGIFLRVADWFSGERSDDALYLLIQKLYDFSRSHSWPDDWLGHMASQFLISDITTLDDSPWVQSIVKDAKLSIAGASGLLQQAISLAMSPGGPAPYVDNLRDDLEMVESLRECLEDFPWNALYDAFQTISFGKLKSCRKDETDADIQERVKELRDNVKKILNELKNSLFGRSADTYLNELHDVAPVMKELSEVVIQFGQLYQAEKKSRAVVDFSDLEHYCLQILRHPDSSMDQLLPSDAAIEYANHFDEVLLDEYQDTNNVQEDIVRLISRDKPGNRFMVGDVKQSIYRFRLADPGLFMDKYSRYGVEENEGTVIDLARNFRSRHHVLDAVNVIFRQIMNENVAEISYNERAELVYGATFQNTSDGLDQSPYTPEMVLIDRENSGRSNEEETSEDEDQSYVQEIEWVEMETAQLEARAIAKKIKEMTGETGEPLFIFDKESKTMRPVVHGDMVILLRSAYIWGPLIMDELRQQGIACDGEQNQGYFQATEVEIMMSLLQLIDNPLQDIPLASVLRSPIVGITEEELAQVRLCASGSFYEAIIAAAEVAMDEDSIRQVQDTVDLHKTKVSSELSAQLRQFLHKLERWRNEARRGSLGDLIWQLYKETGYMDWVGGLPGGRQRQSNLTALYDRAVQYEHTTASRGLFRFLTFIARLRDHGSDLGAPGGSDKQEHAVRIMTIHKSKGLEFPVVFIAGIAKNFNQKDLNQSFLMHKELGFGPKFVDHDMRVSYPTLPYLAIRRRSQQELLAEEMRVLYVGLTRPKEKLILIGTTKDLTKKILSWTQVQTHQPYILPDHVLSRGRNYLDWIGPALIRHRNAEVLRQIGGVSEAPAPTLSDDPSVWAISILKADELSQPFIVDLDEKEVSLNREQKIQAMLAHDLISLSAIENREGSDEAKMDSRLAWTYPHAVASTLAAKTSVTEMKKILSLQELPSVDWVEEKMAVQQATLQLRRPKFMENKSMSATERGTVYHTIMQHIPLDLGEVDSKIVEETLQLLADLQIITKEQSSLIDAQEIARLFLSDIGSRLLHADWVEREMPFSYALSATEAYQGLNVIKNLTDSDNREASVDVSQLEQETVLIQGVVDCIFRDNGKLILIDYKTDRVLEERGGVQALVEQYRFQLELYSQALEDIMGEPLHELWLYFFDGAHWAKL
ncbi:helicase-exonuclease AddAB subunit AddA [Paenibacillus sp. CMAA1364]